MKALFPELEEWGEETFGHAWLYMAILGLAVFLGLGLARLRLTALITFLAVGGLLLANQHHVHLFMGSLLVVVLLALWLVVIVGTSGLQIGSIRVRGAGLACSLSCLNLICLNDVRGRPA